MWYCAWGKIEILENFSFWNKIVYNVSLSEPHIIVLTFHNNNSFPKMYFGRPSADKEMLSLLFSTSFTMLYRVLFMKTWRRLSWGAKNNYIYFGKLAPHPYLLEILTHVTDIISLFMLMARKCLYLILCLWDLSRLLHIAVLHLFSLLFNIPLITYIHLKTSIPLLLDICAISSLQWYYDYSVQGVVHTCAHFY